MKNKGVSMFTITGFADELCSDFEKQMKLWHEMQIDWLELRSAWGVNVMDLTDKQLEEIKNISSAAGVRVSCIGSPIGKTYIEDSFEFEMKRLQRACDIAVYLNTDRVRVFSFYSRTGNILDFKESVLCRLREMADYARQRNIVLLHENEANVYGEHSAQSAEIARELKTEYFGLVFDPANYSVAGENALISEETMHPYISYMHVKDYSGHDLTMSIPGEGVSGIAEIFNRLRDRDMFISMEPHLSVAGQFGGETSPEQYMCAVESVRRILREEEIPFR